MKTQYISFLYSEEFNEIIITDEKGNTLPLGCVDTFEEAHKNAQELLKNSNTFNAVTILRLESIGRKSAITWSNTEESEEPIKELTPRKRPKPSDIDPIHTRQNTAWSPDDDDFLCKSFTIAGTTKEHIAHELERTVKAVSSRITVLRNRQRIPPLVVTKKDLIFEVSS
jgi:hypothetical protein